MDNWFDQNDGQKELQDKDKDFTPDDKKDAASGDETKARDNQDNVFKWEAAAPTAPASPTSPQKEVSEEPAVKTSTPSTPPTPPTASPQFGAGGMVYTPNQSGASVPPTNGAPAPQQGVHTPQMPSANGGHNAPYYQNRPPYQPGNQNYGSPYSGYPGSYGQPGGYGQPPMKPQKKSKGTLVAIVSVVVFFALFFGIFFTLSRENVPSTEGSTNGSQSQTKPSTAPTSPNGENNGDSSTPDFNLNSGGDEVLTTKEIIKKNNDSTVVVQMYQKGGFGEGGYYQVGNASGIVWTEDGYIITNAHCVADTDSPTPKTYARIDIKFYNGEVYEDAKIIAFDIETDLAVVKVDLNNLTVAEFGDSSKLEVGDTAVALGNASGLPWTASQGIISGLERDIYEDGYALGTLQTDAAINPGNSGGPLINEYGQVIGINSAKLTDTDNVGFAIPINGASKVLQDLVTYGYPKGRVKIGITGQDLVEGGFRIESIGEGSSFAGKDIRQGDVIVGINGKQIVNRNELRKEMSKYKPGDTVTIAILRSGTERMEVNVILIEDTQE